MDEIKYVPLIGNVVPVYRFVEGEKKEEFWIDAQNCDYYTYCNEEYDEETSLLGGKNWWIMWPYVPEGTKNEEVTKEIVRWVVDFSSVNNDIDKEWDFENHKVK